MGGPRSASRARAVGEQALAVGRHRHPALRFAAEAVEATEEPAREELLLRREVQLGRHQRRRHLDGEVGRQLGRQVPGENMVTRSAVAPAISVHAPGPGRHGRSAFPGSPSGCPRRARRDAAAGSSPATPRFRQLAEQVQVQTPHQQRREVQQRQRGRVTRRTSPASRRSARRAPISRPECEPGTQHRAELRGPDDARRRRRGGARPRAPTRCAPSRAPRPGWPRRGGQARTGSGRPRCRPGAGRPPRTRCAEHRRDEEPAPVVVGVLVAVPCARTAPPGTARTPRERRGLDGTVEAREEDPQVDRRTVGRSERADAPRRRARALAAATRSGSRWLVVGPGCSTTRPVCPGR